MKRTYLILLCIISISCVKSTTDNINANSKPDISSEKQLKENDKLIGTWYVKELLIDGKPDPENYPVSNDELIFKPDLTVISIDHTYDMEGSGTWERISEEKFAINTEDERVVFQIVKLTDTELETKMLTDEIDMVIIYERQK